MRNVTIVESNVEPNKEHLWFYNGKLKWFGPNGWEEINSQVLSPTTTPKPVVTTTTTSTTTSTALSTFKLINNTGDTLNIMGLGYINGGVSTLVPPVPNGGSVLLIKYNSEGVWLQSHSNSKLGIIVDGENRGELPLGDQGSSPWYELSKSIFNNATEISVYSVGA